MSIVYDIIKVTELFRNYEKSRNNRWVKVVDRMIRYKWFLYIDGDFNSTKDLPPLSLPMFLQVTQDMNIYSVRVAVMIFAWIVMRVGERDSSWNLYFAPQYQGDTSRIVCVSVRSRRIVTPETTLGNLFYSSITEIPNLVPILDVDTVRQADLAHVGVKRSLRDYDIDDPTPYMEVIIGNINRFLTGGREKEISIWSRMFDSGSDFVKLYKDSHFLFRFKKDMYEIVLIYKDMRVMDMLLREFPNLNYARRGMFPMREDYFHDDIDIITSR